MVSGSALGEVSDPDLLVVGQTQWGFDGSVQRGKFVPLSIELKNASELPWSGTLQLRKSVGIIHEVGARTEITVSLQGNESRWVQIVPFVDDNSDNWTLSWGPLNNHRAEFNSLKNGPDPTVLIIDPDAVSPEAGPLRKLREDLFPNSVTSTDSLRGVVLAHVPFWQGARANAFREWLHNGGRVYILLDDDGNFPSFPKNLGFLNSQSLTTKYGTGVIKRIPREVAEIDLNFARKNIFTDDVRPKTKKTINTNNYQTNPRSAIFSNLRKDAKYERSWMIIYISVCAYFFVLFPFCYRVGREQKYVRYYYLAFFGSVTLFSLLFIILGQVGANSQNRIRMATLAHHTFDGSFDVTDWAVLANVNSGELTATFDGSNQHISTSQTMDPIDGMIHLDVEPDFTFTQPVDSSTTLLVRRRVTTPMDKPVIDGFEMAGNSIMKLGVSHSLFENPQKTVACWAVHKGLVYELDIENQKAELPIPIRKKTIMMTISPSPEWQFGRWGLFGRKSEEEESLTWKEQADLLFPPMLKQDLGMTNMNHEPRLMVLPENIVRMCIAVQSSDEFLGTSSDFPDQRGTTLFVYDLPVNSN